MKIDIDKLPKEGLSITKEFEYFDEDLIEEEAVFLRPVWADIYVKKSGEQVFIKGKMSTCLNLVCCRCLNPFEFSVNSNFDLVYFPEEFDEIKEQLGSDDINRLFYHKRSINLREVVLEQLNLTFPFRPLCSENCQGICPVCGKLIAEGMCSCVHSQPDPRFGKLKSLYKDKE